MEKLRSINGEYIQNLSDDEFLTEARKTLSEAFLEHFGGEIESLRPFLPILRERIKIFSDIEKMKAEGGLDYIFNTPEYAKENLSWKDDSPEKTTEYLRDVLSKLKEIDESDFTSEIVKENIWDYASKEGRGSVLWPMRYALSGKDKSPDPFLLSQALGKKETLSRIEYAIQMLS